MKAILELKKVPKSCTECPILAHYQEYAGATDCNWCPPMERVEELRKYKDRRSPYCPLKIVE